MNQNETIRINIDIDDRGLHDLNTVISDLRSTLDDLNGTLSSSMSSVQDTVSEFRLLESVFGTANSTLDILQRTLSISAIGLQNLDRNLEFLTGTTGIFSAATTGSQIAIDKKTSSMGLATIAATGLKWAMKAIPFVGLIALVGSLFSWLGNLTSGSNNAEEATEGLEKAVYNLRQELDNNRASHESNIRQIRAHGQTMEGLIDIIEDLTKGGELSEEQLDALRVAVGALDRNTSAYNLTVDDLLDASEETRAELLENMRSYHQLGTAIDTTEEKLDEFIRLHNDIEYANDKIYELTGTNENLGKTYPELREAMEGYLERMDQINSTTVESVEEATALDEEYRQLIESFSEAEEAILGIGQELADYQTIVHNATERTEELEIQIVESMDNIAEATAESIEAQVISFEDLSEAQRDVAEELSRTFNNYVDQLRGSNGKIRVDNEFTADHWRETMEHNQKVMGEWADNVDSLSGRISDEMLDYIRTLGPEHAHLVQDMVNMSDAELQDLEGVFRNNCQFAASAALAGIDEANIPIEVANLIFESERTMNDAIRGANFGGLGLNLAEGLRDGIKDGETLVGTGAAELAREAERAIREESETNSPSKVFHRIGGDLVSGLNQGIEALQSQPTRTLQTLATAMQRVYNNVNSTYQAVGHEIINGVNSGLLGREAILNATANRIAGGITRTMKNALAIASPSRVMREQIGRFIPEGIAAGIDKYADAAMNSVHKLSNDIINLNLPSVESMIGLQPSMRLLGATDVGSTNNDYRVVNNNQGLFEGANINWSGEQDIRRTMEKIAWVTKQEQARLWR